MSNTHPLSHQPDRWAWNTPRTREPRPDDLEVLELSEFLSIPMRAAQRVYAVVEA